MPVLTPTTATTAVVQAAHDVPTFLAGMAVVDPDLHKQLVGEPAWKSKAAIGPAVGLGVGWFVGHFGLACTTTAIAGCWTPDTINAVSNLLMLGGTALGAYVGRVVFGGVPITSWLHKPAAAVPDPAAAALVAMKAVAATEPPVAPKPIPVSTIGAAP